jgi:hypothetical protein
MNLSLATLILFCVNSASAAISPTRVSYEAVVNHLDADRLLHALQTVGIVSITNVPDLRKQALLQSLPECIKAVGVKTAFADGTVRRTIATHSQGSEMWEATSTGDEESCDSFESQNVAFRAVVGQVVNDFGSFLEGALSLETTLLQHATIKEKSFSLMDIVHEGDHLEHFHAYYTSSMHDSTLNVTTIDWHVDQGLLLAFSPGQSNGRPTDGFYIQLDDGSTEMVHFNEEDDLVFFFGDGVNQIINPVLISEGKSPMRVLPHTLRMPKLKEERLWYGRMVLAPADALHPVHGKSFGFIRDNMIKKDEDFLSIGCSSSGVARLLHVDPNPPVCNNATSSYCWHSCMNYTDYGASPKICAKKKMLFGCMNATGALWNLATHDPTMKLTCYKKPKVPKGKKPKSPKNPKKKGL